MRRLLLPASAAALPLTGCTTGSDQVEVDNGGEFRFGAGTPRGQVVPADDRATAPEFRGTLLGGEPFSSGEPDGDITVLDFWGSWCPPCRVESPQFQEVNVKDDEQLARAFEDRQGIDVPSISGPRGELALAFRVYPANAVRSTIVPDRQGRGAAVYTAEVAQQDLRDVSDLVLAEGG